MLLKYKGDTKARIKRLEEALARQATVALLGPRQVGKTPDETIASFYRTTAGAEIDLVLELPGNHGIWAIEIKRGLAAQIEKGFHIACEDIRPKRKFIVYSGDQSYPMGNGIEAISVKSLASLLANL